MAGYGDWLSNEIHGFLFDIYGVLYEKRGPEYILFEGSVEAIRR